MTQWYKKLQKESALGHKDYVYEVYLQPALLERTDLKKGTSRSQYGKNLGLTGGGRLSNAKPEYIDALLQKAERVMGAHNDIVAYVDAKYGKKKFQEEFRKLQMRANSKEEKQNGYKNLRAIYPVPDKFIQSFVDEYWEFLSTEIEQTSKLVRDEEIYTQLIAPNFYSRREKGEILFIYNPSFFTQSVKKYPYIRDAYDRLKDSIEAIQVKYRDPLTKKLTFKKQITEYDKKSLDLVLEGFDRHNELQLGELQSQALYEVADSTKKSRSFHEFAIRDILAICGINFDIEVPFKIMDSTIYKEPAVIDFVLPGQELFEVFGDSRGNYEDRKVEKIDKLPNLWYIDYAEKMTQLNVERRTLSMYCESLNTQCYNNRTPDPVSGALQGKDYLATLESRLPLLNIEHMAQIDLYWHWAMNLPVEILKEIRNKIKMFQKSPEYQPLPMATAQYNINQDSINIPNMKEIYSSLVDGQVAPAAKGFNFPDGGGFSPEFISQISGQELIAIYFQTPQVLEPYLQKISDQIDAKIQPLSSEVFEEKADDVTTPYPFVPPQLQIDPSMVDNNEEPRLRAAKSNKFIKIAEISLNEKDFNSQIKDLIKKDSFFQRLFAIYEVPVDAVSEKLNFHIVELNGRHAKSKGNDIYINSKLMKINDKVEDILHFVVHEMTHWLTRQREKMCYFSDPEELEAFAIGMAFELRRGQSDEKIREIYYPIIEAHFKQNGQAEKMFAEFMKSAYILNKNIFS